MKDIGATLLTTKSGRTFMYRGFKPCHIDGEDITLRGETGAEINVEFSEGVQSIYYNADIFFDSIQENAEHTGASR